MPLDRFVLLVMGVLAAAGATVFLAAWFQTAVQAPWIGLSLLLPLGLTIYVIARVTGDRLRERAAEGDRYEGQDD